MGRKLLFASICTLILLIFGTQLAPDSSMFWLASADTGYQVLRFGLLLVVLLQFATEPPRNRIFRTVSGIVAVIISTWVLYATYGNHMLFLDTLCLLGSCVAIGLNALEREAVLHAKSQPKINMA